MFLGVSRPAVVALTLLVGSACTDSPLQVQELESIAAAYSVNAMPGLDGGGAFQVQVTVKATLIPEETGPVGTVFPNCYAFQEDGVWVDPFFVAGTWSHVTDATATARYSATAGPVDGLLLEQRGTVTPFRGGTLKLKARTELILAADGTVLAEFLSQGLEVDSCSP